MWIKKIECAQRFLSVLSMSVGVECGVWSVECDSAVSGEPPGIVTGNPGVFQGYLYPYP